MMKRMVICFENESLELLNCGETIMMERKLPFILKKND